MPGAALKAGEILARTQVGYREGPRNNETKYGKYFGMNFVAWCAIFLSWLSAHTTPQILYFGKPWRFASTIAARDHAKKNKRWITTPTVATFAMMAHTATTGHIGFVIYIIRRNGVLIVGTIEGNTNDQGAREGNGVWLRERVASSWDGYIILDGTYDQGEEDDMFDAPDRQLLEQLHSNLLVLVDDKGGKHNTAQENWQRLKNLEAVADRDFEAFRPMLKEILDEVKKDPNVGSGVGDVDPDVFIDRFVARLKE